MNLNVGTVDIEGLRIQLSPAVEARAKLRFENGAPPDRESIAVTLRPLDPELPSATSHDEGGVYVWNSLRPGNASIAIDSLPESMYLKSPREIEIGTGRNEEWEIVVSSGAALVEGKVEFPDDVDAVRVILIGAGNEIEKNVTADPDGTFSIRAIAPGKYTLIAIEDDESVSWRNPDVLKSLAAKGTAVELAEGGAVHRDLKLIR
jgi:hypothetical protein